MSYYVTRELASLYTVPLSAINGLSRLTTTSNGQARPIRKFANGLITFESNRNGRFKFESNLEASQVPINIPPCVYVCVLCRSGRSIDQCPADLGGNRCTRWTCHPAGS